LLDAQTQLMICQHRLIAVAKLADVAMNAPSHETVRRAASDLLKIRLIDPYREDKRPEPPPPPEPPQPPLPGPDTDKWLDFLEKVGTENSPWAEGARRVFCNKTPSSSYTTPTNASPSDSTIANPKSEIVNQSVPVTSLPSAPQLVQCAPKQVPNGARKSATSPVLDRANADSQPTSHNSVPTNLRANTNPLLENLRAQTCTSSPRAPPSPSHRLTITAP
ncbi:MAG: hypothetical protein L0Y42_05515, partial [Phycisphaerales bacterium]|nr:hypothetical protein [Phycisphaerales bacterium]